MPGRTWRGAGHRCFNARAEKVQELFIKWLSARQYLQCPCPSPGEIVMQDDIVALFAYDRWANRKVLDACRKLTAEQYVAEPVPGWSSVRSTLSHIALATEFNLRTLAD